MADEDITLAEMGAEIAALVGKDINILELPQADHFAWWHPEHKKYVTFKRGQPHPWFPKVQVCAMFRDVDELRVYTVPAGPMGEEPGPDGKMAPVWPFRRYYLSKKDGGSFEVENLYTQAGFIEAIADEWVLVAEGVRSAERERNQVVAFLEALDEGDKASDAAPLIAAGQHWIEEPEEPGAPETPEAPAPNGSETPSVSSGTPLPS